MKLRRSTSQGSLERDDTLRAEVGEEVALLVGGAAAPAYSAAIQSAGGRILTDTQSLRRILGELSDEIHHP